MANTISGNDCDDLRMSNITTSTLLTALCLSGSRVAITESEKDFIIFLAEHDQGIVGIGTVGFDVGEMPWHKEILTQEKEFILRVVDYAISGLGYETLSYSPAMEYMIPRFHHFRKLIEAIDAEAIQEQAIAEWYDSSEEHEPRKNGYPYCEKHHVLLTCFGCIACNDN